MPSTNMPSTTASSSTQDIKREGKAEINQPPNSKTEDSDEQGTSAHRVKSQAIDNNTPPSTPKRERTPISNAPIAPPPPQTPSKQVKKEDPETPSSKRVKKESDDDDAPNPLDWTVSSRSSSPPLHSAPASPSSPLADRLGQRVTHQRQLGVLQEGNVGEEELAFTSIADIWANAADGNTPRFPQRGPPCKRFRCRQPSTFFVVSRHNRNGNALRPAYRCEPCSEFVTFADRRNVLPGNPRCACGQLSRMEQTGENAKAGPGKKFFVCMEGRCRFMEWSGGDAGD